MPNALLARFPLGVYQGHASDGSTEELPQLSRVFSALVNSACRGATAEVVGDEGRPTTEAITALRWLEEHPPDALRLPEFCPTARRRTLSYRREGVFDQDGRDRVVGKLIGRATAVVGPIGWVWTDSIPADIADTLDVLSADVAYLGESDSPVALELGDAEPTHRRGSASMFSTRDSLPMRVPSTGRLAELDKAHAAARPGRRPTAAQDKHAMSAEPAGVAAASDAATVLMRYEPERPPVSDAPWSRALLLPIDGRLGDAPVQWCVALHRALAARLGDDAPSVITGHYADGVRRPANRVAIQLLEASMVAHHGLDQPAFAVLVPADIEPEDLDQLHRALSGLRPIYRSRDLEVGVGAVTDVAADDFWPEPPVGTVRLWSSVRPLVPETRPQSRASGGWSLAEAALLSIGFVARDLVPAPGRGPDRYRAVAEAVAQRGVRVANVRRVPDSDTSRYAHKVPAELVVQPFHATLDLADLWGPTALIAVGQSRHLGGGLLHPLDVPEAVAGTWFPQ